MKWFPVLALSLLFLTACEDQRKRENLPALNAGFSSFEERQNRSEQDETPVYTQSAGSGIHYRLAARRATPGVVHIKSVYPVNGQRQLPDFFRDFFGEDFWREYNSPQMRMGSASGVIISDDGYIATNDHVVADAQSIEVVLYDQRIYQAKIIGVDPATDLALLKIEEKNLNFIQFGNSDSIEVGDVVLAVGNPFNLASTVTAGIVSAKARNINIISDQAAIESFIQTDAAVNPGNSGGALVDVYGRLVGINTAIATPTGTYAGYSFAIPVEMVKKTMDDLLRFGKVVHAYLGVFISDMNGEKAKMLGIRQTTGVLVDSLQSLGAAKKAGVQKNDVIIEAGHRSVGTSTQLREIIARHGPGETLELRVIRNGEEKIIPVTLLSETETRQSEAALLKVLGIEIENLSPPERRNLNIEGGVKISRITKGALSGTGIKTGFIVLRVNGKSVNNRNDFLDELRDKQGGMMIEGIYPGSPGLYYYAFGL
jgi:Do/DeqQ family serine protease